jgi:hypothetical protein
MVGAISIAGETQVAPADTPSKATGDDVVAQSDDVRSLVAPVALYPDPILALVLQASTLPLQVVQADRFLGKRAKDANLQPDPDWDKSIIALLNYPRQVQSMSEYIDWTEELGNAVVDNLDEVQGSIQDIRLAAYYAGILQSNKQQKVEVKDDIVRISSTDPKKVSIPQYDPAALLTALDEVDEAEDAADEAAAASVDTAPAARAQASSAAAPPPQAPPPAAPVPGSAGYVAPAAAPMTPPTITYAEPENSFWESAATFAGGAVIGGLLGWGLTEAFDDDDDHDDWWEHDDWDSDDVQDALRDRREFVENRREDILQARDERRDDRTQARQNVIEERAGVREQRSQTRAAQREERSQTRAARHEQRSGTREERAARARESVTERQAARDGKPADVRKVAREDRPQRGSHDVRLPGAGTQAGVAEKVRQRSAAAQPAKPAGEARLASAKQKRAKTNAGFGQRQAGSGIAAGVSSGRHVHREAARGTRSRLSQGGGQPRITPAAFGDNGRRGGGHGIAAGQQRGGAARFDGARGQASRRVGHGGGRRNR